MESTGYVKAFTVMIQFGAIPFGGDVARTTFSDFSLPGDMWHGNQPQWRRVLSRLRFYFQLMVGVLPAVVLGLLFSDWVDQMLGSVWVIAVNLVLGGVVMLSLSDRMVRHNAHTMMTYRNAFVIGLFQCIAIFLPGISRSMSTIVGNDRGDEA